MRGVVLVLGAGIVAFMTTVPLAERADARALVLPPAHAVAQTVSSQDGPPMPTCKKCASTGRLPCTEHKKELCEAEDSVLFCSVIAECPVCVGIGWTSCPECDNPVADAAIAKKKEAVDKRRITLKALDDKMGRPLCKAETAHAITVWELEKHKVDKKFLDQHEALHVYAKRMERLYSDYVARLGLAEKDFREKFKVFVWWLPDDHEKGSLAFCGQNARGGVKLMGSSPTYSICGNKQNFQSDEDLHRNIVHCVAHLLLSAQTQPQWIGNLKCGWADEGLAHWFEDRYWDLCDTYCYQEQNSNVDFKGGRFKLAVRKMVEMKEAPPAAVVFERNTDTLTLPEHAVAMSFVDYLLTNHDGAKFSQMSLLMKKKTPTREAMKTVYGFGPMEFEGMWKAWVLSTYPTK